MKDESAIRSPIRRAEDLTQVHRDLKAALKNECFGRRRARPETEVRMLLEARGHAVTQRDLFHLVQDLRLCGEPVGSGSDGYFWPATRDEFARVVAFYASRFSVLRETTEAMKRTLGRWSAEPAAPALRDEKGLLLFVTGPGMKE